LRFRVVAPVSHDLDEPASVSEALDAIGAQGRPEPPMLGMRDAPASGASRSSSPLMTWHNGGIMTSAAVTSIFWGARWSSASFVSDKISGLNAFYNGYNGSRYAFASTEYTGSNGQVGVAVANNGSLLDMSVAPSRAPRTSAILAEVCAKIASPVANGYYPVYTDAPRGSTSYCAY
jgi:hypothetical protein